MEATISRTDHPDRDLLRLADESEASVADYVGRSICYKARIGTQIVGQYLLLHTRPFTAELVSLAVHKAWQGRGIAADWSGMRSGRLARAVSGGSNWAPATPESGRSPSTKNAACVSSASIPTTSPASTPCRSRKTASNCVTWYACESNWSKAETDVRKNRLAATPDTHRLPQSSV